jgi:hypothetical protein
MKLLFSHKVQILTSGSILYVATCDVRNEQNGRRRLHELREVVRAVVDGQYGPAYMPRPFPLGSWRVTAVEATTDPAYAPYKIRTDAHQMVETWALDAAGGYDHPTGEMVDDGGYHLHYAENSSTTLGCIRVGKHTPDQVNALARSIKAALDSGEAVTLEVV